MGLVCCHRQDRVSKSRLVISWCAAAGKTESVKIMMQYLAMVSKAGDQNKVAQQVTLAPYWL